MTIRIVFFSTYFTPYISGMTVYAHCLLDYLSLKFKVTVLTFSHADKAPELVQPGNFSVRYLPYLFRISKGFVSFQSIRDFRNSVKQSDVIILNLPNAEGLPLAFLARITGRRIVSIFHCMVAPRGGIFSRLSIWILKQATLMQLRLSHRIIAYTEDYVTALDQNVFDDKTDYVLPPVEFYAPDTEFKNILIKRKMNCTWVGFSGRVSSEKGLEILAEALHKLAQPDLKLIIAGPYGDDVSGESGYYAWLKQKLNDTDTDALFLGTLDKAELMAFYNIIDVLVLPSTSSTEAFGLVQIESMRMGTPVVASNLPGVRQPVTLTGMGSIVEPNDSEGLALAIGTILKDPHRYDSTEFQSRVDEVFNFDQALDKLEKIIQFSND